MPAIKLLLIFYFILLSTHATASPFGSLIIQNKRNYPSAATCSYTPPLDATPAAAAYSFRVLYTNWIGKNIITIQRSSDSTQKTFTASAPNCLINTSDPFFDGSTYTVVTWYDQSGNGNNITQATNSNRPTVTLNCTNSLPCAIFTAANSDQLSGTLAATMSNGTLIDVKNYTNVGTSGFWFYISDGTSNNGIEGAWSSSSSGCVAQRYLGGTSMKGVITCTNNTWHSTTYTMTNTLSHIRQDRISGTDNTTSETLATNTTVQMGVGGSGGAYVFANVDMSEAMMFAPDISDSVADVISTNQKAYWGTP